MCETTLSLILQIIMQTTLIYLISFASAVAALLLWKLWRLLDAPSRRIIFSFLRKKILYTLVYQRRRGSGDINVASFINLILFITGNIVACTIRLSDRNELAKRCATLFMINAIPLYLGGRTSFLVDRILRLSLSEFHLFHRWVGRMCVIQGLVHGVINATASSSSVKETLVAMPT